MYCYLLAFVIQKKAPKAFSQQVDSEAKCAI